MKPHEILRNLRKEKGLTIENVANDLKLSYSTYQSYEQEGSNIQLKTLEKIAKYFGMDLLEFFSYRNQIEGSIVLEPIIPYLPNKSKSIGLKVLVELDGKEDHLNTWIERLKKINAALL